MLEILLNASDTDGAIGEVKVISFTFYPNERKGLFRATPVYRDGNGADLIQNTESVNFDQPAGCNLLDCFHLLFTEVSKLALAMTNGRIRPSSSSSVDFRTGEPHEPFALMKEKGIVLTFSRN